MNTPNESRLRYDLNSYKEGLKRSMYPGIYQLDTPYNDCSDCGILIPDDPFMRYQGYGQNTCTMKNAVDDLNELNGLNYKNSKCNDDGYKPNSYMSTGCKTKYTNDPRKCAVPTESCRLSNPPCTLKETGINRYDFLCWDPQEKALLPFIRGGINYRMVAKDNHVPLVEKPQDQSIFDPVNKRNEKFLDKWQALHQNQTEYSPGYPYGNPNYLLSCSQSINTY
jgi:hypothetical protein